MTTVPTRPTPRPKIRWKAQLKTKLRFLRKRLHLGRLEFLLGGEESADPAAPDVDAAVVLIATEIKQRDL